MSITEKLKNLIPQEESVRNSESRFNNPFKVISSEESNDILKKVKILGDRGITSEKLGRADLQPIAVMEFDGVRFYISKQFTAGCGREALLAYVETGKERKEILLCSFYKSKSANVWRYLPSYRDSFFTGQFYEKGHADTLGEDHLNLPAEVQKSLQDFANQYGKLFQTNNNYLRSNLNNMFFGATKNQGKNKNSSRYYKEVSRSTPMRYLNGNYISKDWHPNKKSIVNPSEIIIDEAHTPDFSNEVATWESPNSNYEFYPTPKSKMIYEPIVYRVYYSYDGSLIYTFATTKYTKKTYISQIESSESDYFSFGTKKTIIKTGSLTTPGQEYLSQTFVDGTNFKEVFANPKDNTTYYDLYENYHSNIPLIIYYEYFRKISDYEMLEKLLGIEDYELLDKLLTRKNH